MLLPPKRIVSVYRVTPLIFVMAACLGVVFIPQMALGKVLSVLAGQPGGLGDRNAKGVLARFNGATGIAFDGKSFLYVADTQNSIIRRIAVASGVVSTVAGQVGQVGNVDGKRSVALFTTRPVSPSTSWVVSSLRTPETRPSE